MAYGVFCGGGELCEGFVVALGFKNGVVSKALVSLGLVGKGSVYAAFESVGLIVEVEVDNGFKVGVALRCSLHFGQYFCQVVRVAFVVAGVACGVYSGVSV